jgi:hypothetical protein
MMDITKVKTRTTLPDAGITYTRRITGEEKGEVKKNG